MRATPDCSRATPRRQVLVAAAIAAGLTWVNPAAAQAPRLVDVYGPASVPPGCRAYGCPPPVFAWWPPFLRAPYAFYAPPPVYVPPPVAEAPPPIAPAPLGWVFGRYTVCTDPPGCRAVVVSVGVDGLNVRAAPDGPVVGALANGVPVVPLDRAGPWVLVAPGCPLVPTWTASVTAGGVPLSVCGGW